MSRRDGESVGVVTIVAGRRAHLARQLDGLRRQRQPADHLVIVRMDQDEVLTGTAAAERVTVVDLPPDGIDDRLRLAAARNLGVRTAGTHTAVLLDVDCIPGHDLVAAYARATAQVDGLVCGTLRYLEPGCPAPGGEWTEEQLVAGSREHPARPAPGPGTLVRDDQHALAWTTSLALRSSTFDRIGGFDEAFRGYGGEDTDFGFRAAAAGLGVWWSGDAVAYHQHHPTQSPPVQHVDDIVRNAQLFADRHGWYPMEGWLRAFQDRGLVDFDPERGVLDRISAEPVGS